MVHNIFVSMESEEIVGIPIQFHGDVGRLFPMNHPKRRLKRFQCIVFGNVDIIFIHDGSGYIQ